MRHKPHPRRPPRSRARRATPDFAEDLNYATQSSIGATENPARRPDGVPEWMWLFGLIPSHEEATEGMWEADDSDK